MRKNMAIMYWLGKKLIIYLLNNTIINVDKIK